MYVTPLSTLISSLSLHHHLYADDTQLFSRFVPRTLTNPSLTSRTLSHRSLSWMTSNLLSLISSKTEFRLIGFKRQLSKIHNFSSLIDTTQSALNLGFIFDEHLSFFDQISAFSKSCCHQIRALRCIRLYFDFHIAKAIATSIVQSKLDH